MANPQREHGHLDLANDIVEALAHTQLSGYESRVLWALFRMTWGWVELNEKRNIKRDKKGQPVKKKMASISSKDWIKLTGLNKHNISRTLRQLLLRRMVIKNDNNNEWGPQKNYDKWLEPILKIVIKNDNTYFVIKNDNAFIKNDNGISEIDNKQAPKELFTKQHRPLKETLKETLKESKPKPCEAENLASLSSLPEHPARQGEKRKESEMSQIREVFTYWQQTFNHPKALLSKDRAGKIRSRLREDYTIPQLKRSIDGCKASPYHMGDNDSGKVYDSIGLIFRSAEKVEDFWGYLKKKEQSYDKLREKYSND